MKIAQIRASDVGRALDIYWSHAFPGASSPAPVLSRASGSFAEMLGEFEDESEGAGEERTHKYVLRLGNARYRPMKLAIQEFLLPDEYFFHVDTHDQVDLAPSDPDYERFQEVRAANRALRERIEDAWAAAGLPTIREIERRIAAGPRRPLRPDSPSLLLVDDDRDVSRATARLLEANSYRVGLASDGEEGLARAAALRPDLILLDFMMPRKNGYEVCRALRSDPALARTPVLLITATPLGAERARLADGYLMKPYLGRALLARIERLLVRRTTTVRRPRPGE